MMSLISEALIRLRSYSGVLPTPSPARKTGGADA